MNKPAMQHSGDQTIPKHTPGPWHIKADPYDDGTPYFRFEGHPSEEDRRGYYNDELGRGFQFSAIMSEPDARLIAAAPDLLMALEMTLPALEWCEKQWAKSPQKGDGVNVLAFARAAIAKARGDA